MQWLEHRGRPWSQGVTARQQGLRGGSLLQLHLRLRGGGGDGGSTGAESRSSYLEMYQGKKHDKVRCTAMNGGNWALNWEIAELLGKILMHDF
jgi:hypothetical protein